MKKIHEIPDLLDWLFNTKPFQIVFSVICAVLIWFSVAVTTYKTTHVTFYEVPVSTELSGTVAEASGLSTVSCDVEKVTVQLEGNRSQIGRLTEKDVTAYLEVGNTSTTGEFNFSINVRSESDISFRAVSITPSTAKVRLDKIETRSYPVTAVFPNVKVSAGHVLNLENVVCEPSTIEITGPSAQLDEISKVEVYSGKSIEIDALYSLYANEVRLYTEEGALMDTSQLKLNLQGKNFQISIPVMTQKELALTYDIRNAPNGFALNWLREKLHLSEESITLASQTNTAFLGDNWNLGFVALDSITLDFSENFELDLKSDYINKSGFQNVTLTLDAEGLDSKVFEVTEDNISIVNAPVGYDCQIITKIF